jgi:hypothetical protein
MILRIHSCKDEVLKEELTTAALFFGLQLLSFRLLQNIEVDLYIRKNINDMGNCTILDYNLSGKPRHFEIRLKFFRKKEKMISTLAHELVHLKQFAKLELNDSLNKWKGFPVEEEKISYHDLPWEVEAYCIEEVLMRQYLQYKYVDEKTKQYRH